MPLVSLTMSFTIALYHIMAGFLCPIYRLHCNLEATGPIICFHILDVGLYCKSTNFGVL